jgi:hypothetical protein
VNETNIRPFPVAARSRAGDLYEHEHPRLAAIRHLREAIADRRGGLDPYDDTVFLLDAREHERVWARAAVEQTGLYLGETINDHGGIRYRMILEADVRAELGLDVCCPPSLDDEPLASRRLTIDDEAALLAGEQKLANPDTPVLRAVVDARDAQHRAIERGVH